MPSDAAVIRKGRTLLSDAETWIPPDPQRSVKVLELMRSIEAN